MAQKSLPQSKQKPISKLSDIVPGEVKQAVRPIKSFKAAFKQKLKKELPVTGVVLKNEYEISEQQKEKKMPKNKKVVLNPNGDEVVVNPDVSNEVKEATAVLNVQQRTKRAISIRRRLPKIKRAREIARKRLAGGKTISKRSNRIARKYLKRRLAGAAGSSYSSLPPSSKMAVDRLVSKRQVAIQRLAKRLMPKVKRAETARLRTGARTPSYNIKGITSSYDPTIDQISGVYDLIEKKMQGKDPCWKGYVMVGHKMKNNKKVPNCVPEEHGAGDEGTTKLVKKYKKDTPMQEAYKRFSKKDPVTRLLGHLKDIENRKTPLKPVEPVKQNTQNPK